MFVKPNEAEIRQLARLNTQEFSHLTGFLEKELVEIDVKTRLAAEDSVIHRLQGRGQWVAELLDLIRKAPEMRDRPPKAPKQTS